MPSYDDVVMMPLVSISHWHFSDIIMTSYIYKSMPYVPTELCLDSGASVADVKLYVIGCNHQMLHTGKAWMLEY